MLEEQFNGHHPYNLVNGTRIRVDNDFVRPLTQGQPTLGWEGDTRLVIYVSPKDNRWELWRLESDGQYRIVAKSPIGANLNGDEINKLINSLIAWDTRRGFHPNMTLANNDKLDLSSRQNFQTRIQEEVAPKVEWAMKQDGLL